MPIILRKTLQTVVYDLYIVTDINLTPNGVQLLQNFFQSKGHFNDDFLPIIRKRLNIQNQNIIRVIRALIGENQKAALLAIENFMVQNIPYYQGGIVENGIE